MAKNKDFSELSHINELGQNSKRYRFNAKNKGGRYPFVFSESIFLRSYGEPKFGPRAKNHGFWKNSANLADSGLLTPLSGFNSQKYP